MGWVANDPDESDGDRFPVETMVNKLQSTLRETNEACVVYNGQTKKCCDGIRICFVHLADSFTVVRLQAIGNQDMNIACRSVRSELDAAESCTRTWAAKCHNTVDQAIALEPFLDNLEQLDQQYEESCSNLPPENQSSSTTTTTTPSSSSSSSTTINYPSTTYITGSTNDTAVNDGSLLTSLPETDDTVIIVPSVAGGILLCLITMVLFIFLRRGRLLRRKNSTSEISDHKSGGDWKYVHTEKRQAGTNETEIYAEIDDAFMEAVYKVEKEVKARKKLDRLPSATQTNLCYESTNNGYVITSSVQQPKFSPRRISQKNIHQSPEKLLNSTQINHCYEAPGIADDDIIATRPNQLGLIRKQDDMVTSFQISKSGFVKSRPSFTAISQDSPKEDAHEYNAIEPTPYTTPEEPVYAFPGTGSENQYDTTFDHALCQRYSTEGAYNNDYATFKGMTHLCDTEESSPRNSRHLKKSKSEDSKKNKKNEKKKDKGKKAEPENVYENDDTMMVY